MTDASNRAPSAGMGAIGVSNRAPSAGMGATGVSNTAPARRSAGPPGPADRRFGPARAGGTTYHRYGWRSAR